MKDDASAKELENLLREALSTGLESQRGATPIVQLKTVPLQVQALPKSPASSNGEGTAEEIPSLAEKLAPESIRPPAAPAPKKKRTSVVALGGLAVLALAAIGGAVWTGRARDAVADASAATVAPTTNASEGAVAIGVASRPAEAPSESSPAKTDEAQPTPAPPPTYVASPASPAPSTEPNVRTARPVSPAPAEKVADKTEKVEAKPKPAAPKPPEKKEAKPAEKTAAAPEKTAAAPPPPTPPAGSVDALLQQQLKGAIP